MIFYGVNKIDGFKFFCNVLVMFNCWVWLIDVF